MFRMDESLGNYSPEQSAYREDRLEFATDRASAVTELGGEHMERFVVLGLTRASCGRRFEELRRRQVERLGNRPPLECLREELPELQAAVVLATCCRFEIHGLLKSGACAADGTLAAGVERLLGLNQSLRGEKVLASASPVMVLRGQEALRHWLWTALGGDSILPGESEILGQLKNAYRLAHEDGSLADGALLHDIYQRGSRVVHRLRLEHFAGGGWSTSLPRLALERMCTAWGGHPHSAFGEGKRVAIVGAGQVALKVAAWCLRVGVAEEKLTFYVRNEERARGRLGFPQRARVRLVLDLPNDLACDAPDGLFGAVTHPLVGLDSPAMWHRVHTSFPVVDLSVPAMVSPETQAILPQGIPYVMLETLTAEQARRSSHVGKRLEVVAGATRTMAERFATILEARSRRRVANAPTLRTAQLCG